MKVRLLSDNENMFNFIINEEWNIAIYKDLGNLRGKYFVNHLYSVCPLKKEPRQQIFDQFPTYCVDCQKKIPYREIIQMHLNLHGIR